LCGLWAYWEYKRPGGKLNPQTKQREMEEAILAARRRQQQQRVRV
jgi:hypothetical protein